MFRVKALEKALRLPLNRQQEMLVCQEIAKKCQVLARRFDKRNNQAEAQKRLSLIDQYRPRS